MSPRPFVLPQQVRMNERPLLEVVPAILGAPAEVPAAVNLAYWGNPLGQVGPPSNGEGGPNGIGRRGNNSVGDGPGSRPGGVDRNVYRIGGGVSAPVLVYKTEPEYSEEARKAKLQGTVVLDVIIDTQGLVTEVRVRSVLGLGLDEKAVAAVQRWRFRPAIRAGRPVAVQASVEVNFRLL